MKCFQKILAPTDLSEYSWPGLEYALFASQSGKSELIVLHVASSFEAWEYFSEDMVAFDNDVSPWTPDRVIQEAYLDLTQFLERHPVQAYQPVAIRNQVVLGKAAREIVEVAQREEVDLIVVTPRPRGPIRRLVSGSITGYIIRESPCPVLSVSPWKSTPARRGIPIPSLPLRTCGAEAR